MSGDSFLRYGTRGKRRQSKTHRAPRKARSGKSTPLNAQRNATPKRDLQRKTGERSERGRGNGAPPLSNGFDVLGLIGRRTTAVLEPPMRMARCHYPFEFWSEQARFIQEIISDCQSVALRIVTTPLEAPRMTRSTAR
jgi:hypothetical protein